jgi:cystathionine beta-lyase/cystathionine gamma-synthase
LRWETGRRHGDRPEDEASRFDLVPPTNQPIASPIHLSVAWSFDGLDQLDAINAGEAPGVVYGTYGAPNQRELEAALARLEGSETAIATSGGMSAIAGVLFALLKPGDRVVAARDLFGPTGLLLDDFGRWKVATSRVEATDLEAVRASLRRRVRLLFVETISHPRMRVPDLAALASMVRGAGGLLVVDNTFASPLLCRPIGLGADVVIESATKSLSGHHDVVLGIIATSTALGVRIREVAVRQGLIAGAFDSWLVSRGLETVGLRATRACENATALATWLEAQYGVTRVHYPGLTSHPDHETAGRQLSLYGSMLSFELAADHDGVDRFLRALRVVRFATSLGGVHSTVIQPIRNTHRLVTAAERSALGLHEGFLRLSVGIELVEELKEDLDRALAALRRR